MLPLANDFKVSWTGNLVCGEIVFGAPATAIFQIFEVFLSIGLGKWRLILSVVMARCVAGVVTWAPTLNAYVTIFLVKVARLPTVGVILVGLWYVDILFLIILYLDLHGTYVG